MLAQVQVQAQRHQRAFGVVAHRGVGGVFVLAVVLHPGIKAGLCHRLHLAARRLQHLVDSLGDELEVGGVVNQARTAQQQVVVIAGKALEKPQQLRVVFLVVVVAGKLGGAQPLHVPGVEIFVADEAEQGGVALALARLALAGKVAAPADQGSGVAVFQPAVAVVHGVEHEQVAGKRGLALAVPEANGGFANLLRVGQQPLAVKRWRGPGHHEAVGHTACGELAHPEVAHFHGAVHQFVVVGCGVQAKAFFIDL